MLGRLGDRLYVNSADAIGKDDVYRLFGSAACFSDGSIPWAMVAEQLGEDAIVGGVAIRREFEKFYARRPGTEAAAKQARLLLCDFKTDKWNRLQVTYCSSLSAHAADCAATRDAGIAKRAQNRFKAK